MRIKNKILFVGIILAIVIVADLLIGAVTKTAILNVKDVGVNQTNTAQALFSRKADVLILGSSRANHSFDCKIIEDSLGMSCYNAGRDGQNIVYDAMVFYSYIERHVPKYVILDIASAMMDDSWFDSLHEMNCYYGLAKPLDRIIDENSSWIDRLKLKSNLYRYNNTWQWLIHAYRAKEEADRDGYRPMPVNAHTSFNASFHKGEPFTEDSRCLDYLNRIRRTCEERHIRFIMTVTPTLAVELKGGVAEWTRAYCEKNDVRFFDYSKDKFFYEHPEWFYDMSHLNEKGAELFTKKYVEDIKNEIDSF